MDQAISDYRKEKARRLLKEPAARVLQGRAKKTAPTRPPRKRDDAWLNTPFRVHDPSGVQKVLASALAWPAYQLEWHPRAPRRQKLQAVWWQKETKARRDAAREAVRRGDFPAYSLALEAECGSSVSDEIERAASDFEMSSATMWRLLHGEAKSLSWKFAERLRKRLEKFHPGVWPQLESVLLSPRARKIRDDYVNYIDEEIERFGANRSDAHTVYYTIAERKMIDEFKRKAVLMGAPATRARLAELRVYDGIVAWPYLYEDLAGGRAGRESRRFREGVVRRGLRRELVLLGREMRLFRPMAAVA